MNKHSSKICIATSALTVGYVHEGARDALLENLNLKLKAGELVCFMGQNGIGKSTLIRTLAGLQKPLSGHVDYLSGEVKSVQELPRRLAVVLTDKITAGNMTVGDVVSFGRYPYLNWMVKLSSRDFKLIDQTLEQVHIRHLKDKKLHELSDGQIQMVMIARAVVQDTPIIILDEPTAHLDLNNRLEIMSLLRRLAHDFNKAILVSTHELHLALQTADVIWLASQHKSIVTGIPEDLVLNGAFDSIFQFKGFDLKTGKVEHRAHRDITVRLIGEGHAYLWTRNAFERNGFTVTKGEASHIVQVDQVQNGVRWRLDQQSFFTSLQQLLQALDLP
jgi:iron complex transport system ATP-binding protein